MKKIDLLDLRPCQFVLGIKEVEAKVEKMKKMDAEALKKYCRAHVIPVVLGPKKQMYIIDHHHFARACWDLEIKEYSIKVVKDLNKLTEIKFWNEMERRDWVYLHDQFGLGPHSPSALPLDIRCLADDPYRSLVWTLIDNKTIKKMSVPFFEFKWAAFLRRNLDFCLHSKSDFKAASRMAIKIARQPAAAHLPGFRRLRR